MPLRPGASVGDSIRELETGKTFAHTRKKFGKKRAQKQALAIALKNHRKGSRGKMRHRGKKAARKK